MAVQKNKSTRSKRGMRRSHDALTQIYNCLSIDKTSGKVHLRYHITSDGYYLGRKMTVK